MTHSASSERLKGLVFVGTFLVETQRDSAGAIYNIYILYIFFLIFIFFSILAVVPSGYSDSLAHSDVFSLRTACDSTARPAHTDPRSSRKSWVKVAAEREGGWLWLGLQQNP